MAPTDNPEPDARLLKRLFDLTPAEAEREWKMISERTKAALAAAKARGKRLGNQSRAVHFRMG